MKKKAEELKVNEVIAVAGEKLTILSTEISDLGKQGVKKCRIEAAKSNGEKIVLVRPADYPFEVV